VDLVCFRRAKKPGTALAASKPMTVTTIVISAGAKVARANFVATKLIIIKDSKSGSSVTKKIDQMRGRFSRIRGMRLRPAKGGS
jgi:hypothetical protein